MNDEQRDRQLVDEYHRLAEAVLSKPVSDPPVHAILLSEIKLNLARKYGLSMEHVDSAIRWYGRQV